MPHIVAWRVCDQVLDLEPVSWSDRFQRDVYELTGVKIVVALKGERALALNVPGQPVYELEPKRGSTFGFKGLSSFGIELVRDAQEHVIEAVLTQPGGVLTATRR